jgi:hypothetical protein
MLMPYHSTQLPVTMHRTAARRILAEPVAVRSLKEVF